MAQSVGWWHGRASLDLGVMQVGDEWRNSIAAAVVYFSVVIDIILY